MFQRFITFAIFLFLGSQVYASELHTLARDSRWEELFVALNPLSVEDRVSAINLQDEDGKTVIDILDFVGADVSVYVAIAKLLAPEEMPETETIGNADFESRKDDDKKDEPKTPMKPPKRHALTQLTDEEMGLGMPPSTFGLGSAISFLISGPSSDKKSDFISKKPKHLSSSAPELDTTISNPSIQKIVLTREEALHCIKAKIDMLLKRETDHKAEESEAMQNALALVKAHKNTDGTVAYKVYDNRGYEVVVYISGSVALIITDRNEKKKLSRAVTSPTSQTISTVKFSTSVATGTTSTSSPAIMNPHARTPLTREQAIQYVRDKIEKLINVEDLEQRRKKIENSDIIKRAIRALSGLYEANGEIAYVYKLRDGSDWEVVVFCDENGKEYNVYVIYPDRVIGKGSDGTVQFVHCASPSTKSGDIRIVKKIGNDPATRERFKIEREILGSHCQCTGVASSTQCIYEFMMFGGIRISGNIPSALKKEVAFLLLRELNARWHLQRFNHGDVKPDNILIYIAEDGRVVIRFCDLGFAHKACDAKVKPVIGTPFFREPEAGREAYSYRADNYAAALTILSLLEPNFDLDEYEKTIPFDADNTHEDLEKAFPKAYVDGDVDPDIERDEFLFELLDLLRWMTHKNPAKRPKLIIDENGNVIVNDIGDLIKRWEELYFKPLAPKELKRKSSVRARTGSIPIPGFHKIYTRKKSESSSSKLGGDTPSGEKKSPNKGAETQRSDRKSPNSGNNSPTASDNKITSSTTSISTTQNPSPVRPRTLQRKNAVNSDKKNTPPQLKDGGI